jgi:hypothetical protein
VIVHTASAIDSRIVSALIEALGQRRELSGEETYFIHVSLSSIPFYYATEHKLVIYSRPLYRRWWLAVRGG